jgi:hypothetical protein
LGISGPGTRGTDQNYVKDVTYHTTAQKYNSFSNPEFGHPRRAQTGEIPANQADDLSMLLQTGNYTKRTYEKKKKGSPIKCMDAGEKEIDLLLRKKLKM